MRWSIQILMVTIAMVLVFGTQYGFATPSLEISTSKQVYEYGDFLSINFQISEVTGNDIIIHIIDSSNKTSAPIDVPVNKTNSTITAPVPLDKTRFSPGTYYINAEYSGAKASTSFQVIDSGKIVIPVQFKLLVNTMAPGSPIDQTYAGIIREMINENILNISNYNNQTNQIHIPKWFENNVRWWSENLISDNDFGMATEYLIQKGIMQV